MNGKSERRQRIKIQVLARRAAYAKWCEETLTMWDEPPLTYRQWLHPQMRAKIQAALDGAYI